MKVLAWLVFPLVVTLLAMCWAAWRGRSRGPRRSGGAFASVEDFRRFNDALAAPTPSATPERRRRFGRARRADTSDHVGKPSDTGDADTPGTAEPRGPMGTLRSSATLDASATPPTRKLGSAGMFGSTKTAGQGS